MQYSILNKTIGVEITTFEHTYGLLLKKKLVGARSWSMRKVHLELVLDGALFFNIFRIDILMFQKIPKKILDVEIYVLHSSANFQSEIVCTPTYTKMTNSVRSENFKSDTVHRLRLRNLSFLHSSKYKIFRIGFMYAARTDNCLQLYFFAELFET